jgi:hypothetical protein
MGDDSLNQGWYEDEKGVFRDVAVGLMTLLVAILANKNEYLKLDVGGKPFVAGISIWLFLLSYLNVIRAHLIELRLYDFYLLAWPKLTAPEKSLEQILAAPFLHCLFFLSLSIIHFYIFLLACAIFSVLSLIYDYQYYRAQKREDYLWAKNIFDPMALFRNWCYLDCVYLMVVAGSYTAIEVFKSDFKSTAYRAISVLFLALMMSIYKDRKFFIDYYPGIKIFLS